jgi:hypothetical protein
MFHGDGAVKFRGVTLCPMQHRLLTGYWGYTKLVAGFRVCFTNPDMDKEPNDVGIYGT